MPAPTATPPTTKPALMGVLDLIKASWEMYQQKIWQLVAVQFVFYVINLLISLALAATAFANIGFFLFSATADYQVTDWFKGFSLVSGLIFVVLLLISLLIAAFQQSALIHLASQDDKQLGSILKKSFHRVPALFWATFLAGLLIMIGLFLFLIPGIILAVMLAFVSYVVVLEGVGGTQALSRSRALVKGRWFEVFWRGLAFMLIIGIPAGIVSSIIDGIVGDNHNTISNLLMALFITPFGLVYGYNLYRNLKSVSGTSS